MKCIIHTQNTRPTSRWFDLTKKHIVLTNEKPWHYGFQQLQNKIKQTNKKKITEQQIAKKDTFTKIKTHKNSH